MYMGEEGAPMEPLYVRMLGEFSLQAGCVQISDRSSRSKKVWVMLAYLLNHRRQIVSRKELVDLLWRDESSSSNPENTLKVTLHRARTLLNELWPQAGHQLILFKNGGYTWNTDIPMIVDADEFERLCKSRYEDSEEQIEALLNAIALYRGEFLGSLSAETWTVSMTTYFHNLYIQTVLDVVPLLAAGDRHEDVVTVCKEALLLEAYHEPLHQHLMQAMLAQGDYKGTAAVYEKLSQQMFDEMGVKPSKETVALYRTALQTISSQSRPMEEVLAYLQEPHAEGAMQCDYDYFKILCHAEARSARRNGESVHIAMISLVTEAEKELSRRSRMRIMENLGNQIRTALRQSDTFSQCSSVQYILLLPQTNYENGCKVCRRILDTFFRRYPHTPAGVRFEVRPLISDVSIG